MNKLDKNLNREAVFLIFVYLSGLALRLIPHLFADPRLLTFQADIWYRICLAQSFLDHGSLPQWDIRYLTYGQIPLWYNPLPIYFLGFLSRISACDLATVCSRIVPFFESLAVLPIYFLCRSLYNRRVAETATIFLSLTPAFVYWTNVATPQSYTLFALPLTILLWIQFTRGRFLFAKAWAHLLVMGIMLAVNFLMHLTLFNVLVVLFLVQIALMRERLSGWRNLILLLIPVFLSQLLTIWWWLPKNLYWWWTQVLSTSTAFDSGGVFLKNYGRLSAVLGLAAFFYVIVLYLRRKKNVRAFYLVPVLWAVFPLIESQIEIILLMMNRADLAWSTFVRPIEGFRFYSFLAQPLAICFALTWEHLLESFRISGSAIKKVALLLILGIALIVNMLIDNDLWGRMRIYAVDIKDIKAAQWFRAHSKDSDKIITDYYTAQMFSGVCGGKALLGALFPLKKKVLPYISEGYQVLFDIYSVFTTDDPRHIESILKKYKCSHVYSSPGVLRYLEFVVNGYGDMQGLEAGVYDVLKNKDYSKTLLDRRYFYPVYVDGDKMILQWVGQP